MTQTVLIISDEAEFSRALTGRWQTERSVPTFTLMSSDLCGGDAGFEAQGSARAYFDAALVGGVEDSRLSAVLRTLYDCGKPILLVRDCGGPTMADESHPRLLALPRADGWRETAILLMIEILHRTESMEQVARLECANRDLEREAVLGRYLLDMRHTLNDAMTSVLGNSELLLQDPRILSAEARSQLRTVRNMSLRIHEVLQRFSSIENELNLAEREPGKDGVPRTFGAAAGP